MTNKKIAPFNPDPFWQKYNDSFKDQHPESLWDKALNMETIEDRVVFHSHSDEIYNPIIELEDTYDNEIHDGEYDFLVFIGRFQPFHLGHKRVVDIALRKAKKVIMLIGSSNRSKSVRNPFSYDDRATMIYDAYPEIPKNKLLITPLDDFMYNDNAWIKNVQFSVHSIITNWFVSANGEKPKIGLIGSNKDESSYYLKLFPQWGNVNVHFLNPLNATDIRNAFFDTDLKEEDVTNIEPLIVENSHVYHKTLPIRSVLTPNVLLFMVEYIQTKEFKKIKDEYLFIQNYKKQWEVAPYPVTHVTVDAVVIQSGHVLLVKRRGQPGKGLLALPGGFLNQHEFMEDGMIRELKEETKLKVPVPVLKGSIKDRRIFDDPNRSDRGRTITQAFLIHLTPNEELPKVRGADDAEKAMWVPVAELDPFNMFEDHYSIIHYFTNKL